MSGFSIEMRNKEEGLCVRKEMRERKMKMVLKIRRGKSDYGKKKRLLVVLDERTSKHR